MGKKGGWFSAIKRVFSPSSKEKLIAGAAEKNNPKEKKKKGLGKLKHAEGGRSFIPLFREPSSIEKILGDADKDPSAFDFRPLTPPGPRTAPSNAGTPRVPTPQHPASPPRGSTSRRRSSPPRVLTIQRESPLLTLSTSQRSSSPPRTSSPEISSPPPPPPPPPPKRSSSWKGPPKHAPSTSQSFGSPTRSNASQRLDSQNLGSPPRSTASQRLDSSPRGFTGPQRISSAPQRGVSPPPPPPPLSNVSSSRAAASPKIASSPRFVHRLRPEPTLSYQHACATKIQTAYRGYTARRSYRSLRGLVRLQAVVKGQSVKRQTVNAMKCMQLLVRVQTQIQSRRIQMLENQALQRQAMYKNAIGTGKWAERGQGNWDDSPLTKEEADSRINRKAEAVMKRERAMAYAYSNQLWKVTPRTAQAALMDLRSSGGYPWWWNWLDRQETPAAASQGTPARTPTRTPGGKPFDTASSVSRNFNLTPPRSVSNPRASPSPSLIPSQTSNYTRGGVQPENLSGAFDSFDTPTPRSSRSAAPFRSKLAQTPPPPQRFGRMSKPGGSHSPFGGSTFKDDDSLTSCPPFSSSVPRYMEPTASAKAKLRDDEQQKRRVSFPLGRQGVGSFKWNKRGGGLFSTGMASPSPSITSKDAGSQRPLTRKPSMSSIGNASVDSTVSMPANVGRKPFNRFV